MLDNHSSCVWASNICSTWQEVFSPVFCWLLYHWDLLVPSWYSDRVLPPILMFGSNFDSHLVCMSCCYMMVGCHSIYWMFLSDSRGISYSICFDLLFHKKPLWLLWCTIVDWLWWFVIPFFNDNRLWLVNGRNNPRIQIDLPYPYPPNILSSTKVGVTLQFNWGFFKSTNFITLPYPYPYPYSC